MGRLRKLSVLAIAGLAAACSSEPVSLERAKEMCMEPARKAQAPTGSVGFGVDSNDGFFSQFKLEVTGDYLSGRSPDEVFEECVVERSGTIPDQTYTDITGGS